MSKLQQMLMNARTFMAEVRTELRKCSWPTRSELTDSTLVVILSVLLVALFVGFSDVVLVNVLRLVVR